MMRKFTSLLAILLVFVAVNCFSTCLVAENAPSVPPCHQHHQHPQQQAPCENHPGQLAFSAAQSSAHFDFVLPAVDVPAFRFAVATLTANVIPPTVALLVRPPLIALRI